MVSKKQREILTFAAKNPEKLIYGPSLGTRLYYNLSPGFSGGLGPRFSAATFAALLRSGYIEFKRRGPSHQELFAITAKGRAILREPQS